VSGIVLAHPEDAERLEQGAVVFDGLYQRFASPDR
jgi:hypothetical protein